MSSDRLLAAVTLALLSLSLGSSIAAFHSHLLEMEQRPHVSDLDIDRQIGALGLDFFQSEGPKMNNQTENLDSLIARLLPLNSTSPH